MCTRFIVTLAFALFVASSASAQNVDVIFPQARQTEMMTALRLELGAATTLRFEDLENRSRDMLMMTVRLRDVAYAFWLEFPRGELAPPTLVVFDLARNERREAVLRDAYDVLDPRALALLAHTLMESALVPAPVVSNAPPVPAPQSAQPAVPQSTPTPVAANVEQAPVEPEPPAPPPLVIRHVDRPYRTRVGIFLEAGLGGGRLGTESLTLAFDGRVGARVHLHPRYALDLSFESVILGGGSSTLNGNGILASLGRADFAGVAWESGNIALIYKAGIFGGGNLIGGAVGVDAVGPTRWLPMFGVGASLGLRINIGEHFAIEPSISANYAFTTEEPALGWFSANFAIHYKL